MFSDFIKALMVGVAASIPIGPIAILVIQKTLCKGFRSGFITSLGSTVVDTLFATIAIFALAFVQNFIAGNPIPIFIGGGCIVIFLGLSMALSNPFRKMKSSKENNPNAKDGTASAKDFATSVLMGLSNPGAIAIIFALMAFFGIAEHRPHDWSFFPVIIGIATGSICYWLGVTALLNHFRKQFNMKTIIWTNRITGAIVVVIGIATIAEGIMRIFVN